MKYLILLAMLFSCGQEVQHTDERTAGPQDSDQQTEIKHLEQTVLDLQGTVAMISSFTTSSYTTCSASLPAFDQRVCQIAQTASAENNTSFFDSLAAMSKIFQNQLYGSDCQDTTSSGCPVAGSITSDLAAVKAQSASNAASIATINSNITTIQGNVTALQTGVAAINTRLNSFNGTGSSIETVVTGINTTLASLQSQINAISGTLSSSAVWKVIQLCNDIVASGPLFEVILEQGDKSQVDGYVQVASSGQTGLGVVAQAGTSGTQYLATTLNSKTCQFKIYDLNSSLKVCWDKSNRSQTSAGIDTACDFAHNCASPSASCTCK